MTNDNQHKATLSSKEDYYSVISFEARVYGALNVGTQDLARCKLASFCQLS